MNIVVHEDFAKRIRVHYDNEAPEPRRFEFWLSMTPHVLVSGASEQTSKTWTRVVKSIEDMRTAYIRADRHDPYGKTGLYTHGDAFNWVDVYAGVAPTREQKSAHLRQWYIWSLWRRARPEHNKRAMGRVRALAELSEVLGFVSRSASSHTTRV